MDSHKIHGNDDYEREGESTGRTALRCQLRPGTDCRARPMQGDVLPIQSVTAIEQERAQCILRELLGRTGSELLIEQPFYCDYGYNIEVGENFYMNVNGVILDGARVTFGNNVFVAPNCGFYTAGHPLDIAQRNQGLEYARPIHIGNDVWIGAGVSVLPGVTIGDGAVIGAGSVVNRDIPPHTLAVGNPCRVIREL